MTDYNSLVLFMYVVQMVHSVEELMTDFPGRWFLKIFTFRSFIVFEIAHTAFWGCVIVFASFPFRSLLLTIFVFLMLANSIEHIVWYIWEKRYVPGVLTAPIHLASFFVFLVSRIA